MNEWKAAEEPACCVMGLLWWPDGHVEFALEPSIMGANTWVSKVRLNCYPCLPRKGQEGKGSSIREEALSSVGYASSGSPVWQRARGEHGNLVAAGTGGPPSENSLFSPCLSHPAYGAITSLLNP